MITQDSLKHYVEHTASGITEIKLLSKINNYTGKVKVLVVKSGVLEVKDNTVVEDFQFLHGVLKFTQKDEYISNFEESKESDEFFKKQEVKDLLISRGKNKDKSICVSGEDIDGVHYRYTYEYGEWNMMAIWAKVTIHLSDEERKQWFVDNPPPDNKFKEGK